MMRRPLLGFAVLFFSVVLSACGGGDSDGPGGSGDDATVEVVDSSRLSYLTLNPSGLYEVEVDSDDDPNEILRWEELGLAFGEMLQVPRLLDGLLWGTVGPGHLVGIDPGSGDVDLDLLFDSKQTVTDYAVADDLVWVQAGFPFADAVLLAVDRTSGDLMFTVEPPAGTTIGGIAVGDQGAWVIGGDPETVAAVSRLDLGSGSVTGTFDSGLVVRYIAVGQGGVWAGGSQFEFEGKSGDAVVRLDPETGEVLATIEIGSTLRAILDYNGAIWVVDSLGPDASGAQLHRIDPATNEITDTLGIGEAGNGSLNLIAGDGYVFAINSADRLTYVINAETVTGDGVITGPTSPVAIP